MLPLHKYAFYGRVAAIQAALQTRRQESGGAELKVRAQVTCLSSCMIFFGCLVEGMVRARKPAAA